MKKHKLLSGNPVAEQRLHLMQVFLAIKAKSDRDKALDMIEAFAKKLDTVV